MKRAWKWVAGICLGLGLLFALTGLVVDRPLRSYLERKMNAKLEGYTTRLHAADFHPFGFGLDLEKLVVIQDAIPDPPVMQLEEVRIRVQWTKLLRAKLVADCLLVQPRVFINRAQTQAENEDEVPMQKRGWQDAVQAIYPLEINECRVENGEFTYVDAVHERPLRLHQIELLAADIRNVSSKERDYPSEMRGTCTVFEHGRMALEGHADFLRKPHVGARGRLTLAQVELDYFAPILARHSLQVRSGVLDAAGALEYAPELQIVDLDSLVLRGVDADYVHTAATAGREARDKRAVVRTAQQLENHPTAALRVRRMRLVDGRLGWWNRSTDPAYRLFVSDMQLDAQNFSNGFVEGPAKASLRGQFVGAGDLAAVAEFRPEQQGSDFDLDLRIEGTPMTRLNDLLRAHGRFDVSAGTFSLYTEMRVQNGVIAGYVKPHFKDMDILDVKTDRGFFAKVYEGVVGGIATLLKNERSEVVTQTDLSGRVDDPKTSTLQIIGNLLRNAFLEAILPGFDRESKRIR